MNAVINEETAIGAVFIPAGLFVPLYIYFRKRELLKNRSNVLYLAAEVLFYIGTGLQFIFRINR